jgi:hypothetical protein
MKKTFLAAALLALWLGQPGKARAIGFAIPIPGLCGGYRIEGGGSLKWYLRVYRTCSPCGHGGGYAYPGGAGCGPGGLCPGEYPYPGPYMYHPSSFGYPFGHGPGVAGYGGFAAPAPWFHYWPVEAHAQGLTPVSYPYWPQTGAPVSPVAPVPPPGSTFPPPPVPERPNNSRS